MREYAYYTQLRPKTRFLNGLRRLFQWRPLEKVLRRLVMGHAHDSLIARLVPPEYLYQKGSWRTLVHRGTQYHLDLSNATDHGAYFGLGDRGDARLMTMLRPDDVIVDIGANIGVRSMAFAKAVPHGRVLSFEPDPDTFRRLKDHLTMNRVSNVHAVNMGVGPEARSERLYRVLDSNSGMNRIVMHGSDMDRFDYTEVHLSPLEPVLADAGLERVDVIKIDVEGFEFEVLKGCEPVILRCHPTLFIELDDDNLRENDSSAATMIAWLEERGYTVKRADTMSATPDNLDHCHFDILCERNGRTGAV